MNDYPALHRGRHLALAASACVVSLALVTAVAMLFDHRAATLWAGLDDHHARRAAACTANGGTGDEGCAERVVMAASNEEALR